MQVVHPLEVEDKVSARCYVTEGELPLSLLDWLQSKALKQLILLLQVTEYVHIVLLSLSSDDDLSDCL